MDFCRETSRYSALEKVGENLNRSSLSANTDNNSLYYFPGNKEDWLSTFFVRCGGVASLRPFDYVNALSRFLVGVDKRDKEAAVYYEQAYCDRPEIC